MLNSFNISYLEALPSRKFFADLFEVEDFLIPEKILDAFKVAILKPRSSIVLIPKDLSTKQALFSFIKSGKIKDEINQQENTDDKLDIFFKNGSYIAVYRRKNEL